MITVYIDVLFMVNFLINILIVESTGLILNEDTAPVKSLLASLLGAVYAVLVFFPNIRLFHSLIMKIALSGVMVRIAFKYKTLGHFLKMWGAFYIVSFIFGGSIIALMSMTNIGRRTGAVYSNGSVYFNLPWQMLFISAVLTYVFIGLFSRVRKRKITKASITRKLVIKVNDTVIETKAIIDTGNSLFDPISGLPVIVCEYEEIRKIFAVEEGEDIMDKMQKSGFKVRLIPFSAVGISRGIMPAFVPDKIEIDEAEAKSCIVGISESRLSAEEDYHALLNPMITIKN